MKLYLEFYFYTYIVYISLFEISDCSAKCQGFPSLLNYSPYLASQMYVHVRCRFWFLMTVNF